MCSVEGTLIVWARLSCEVISVWGSSSTVFHWPVCVCVWCYVNMTEQYSVGGPLGSNGSCVYVQGSSMYIFTFSGWCVLISDLKQSPMTQTERFIMCEFKSDFSFLFDFCFLRESCSFHKYYFWLCAKLNDVSQVFIILTPVKGQVHHFSSLLYNNTHIHICFCSL